MSSENDVKALVGALKALEDVVQNRGLVRKNTQSRAKGLRNDKVQVYVRVVFLKIGEIDTIREKFTADAFIQAKWREPELDGKQEAAEELDESELKEYWSPKLYVENSLGDVKEEVWRQLTFNSSGEAFISEKRRVKGSFQEILELEDFPFDTQDLSLTVSSERSEMELDLFEDKTEPSSVNNQTFLDEQEWHLHKHVESKKRVTTSAYKNTRHKHPALTMSCRATRRAKYFFWNIIVVMMFICSLGFSTFAVEPKLVQNRLQLSFILLLSTITFKFVVSQTLPKVSYLTYLDKYILSSMFTLCVVCVWHSIVAIIERRSGTTTAEAADTWAVISLGSLYVILLLIFFIWNRVLIHKQMKRDFKQDLEAQQSEEKQEKFMVLTNMETPLHSSSVPNSKKTQVAPAVTNA